MCVRFALITTLALSSLPALAAAPDALAGDPADGQVLTDDAPFADDAPLAADAPVLTDDLYNPIGAPPAAAEQLDSGDDALDDSDDALLDDGLPPPPGDLALMGLVGGLVGGGSTVALAAAMVMGTGLGGIMAMSCCSTPKWVSTTAEIAMLAVPLLLPLMLAIPPITIALTLWWADAGIHAAGAASVLSALSFVVLAPIAAALTGFASVYALAGGALVGSALGPWGSVAGGAAGAAAAVVGVSLLTGVIIGGVAAGGAAWGGVTDENRALARLDELEDEAFE
jgi:hypothetical protein